MCFMAASFHQNMYMIYDRHLVHRASFYTHFPKVQSDIFGIVEFKIKLSVGLNNIWLHCVSL